MCDMTMDGSRQSLVWMTAWSAATVAATLAAALAAAPCRGDEAAAMPSMMGMYGAYPMSREASGTSWQPDSTPLQGIHRMIDDWMTMWDGFLDLNYDRQGGPRGDAKTFSNSMLMFMARHGVDDGAWGLRLMVSADPLMGKSGYPELFQTGETADGVHPLIDRQHPHNLLMEAAGSYSWTGADGAAAFVYAGLAGEPALGPPAFMHRFSGEDNPQAPLGHHWLDSTHVTYGVITGGYVWGKARIEASSFNGREPDQNRYEVELRGLDSYSLRLSYNPTADLSLQVSGGRLASPEQLSPEISVRRGTASVSYNHGSARVDWQTTAAWGRNDPSSGAASSAWLLETAFVLDRRHTVFGRLERVGKDELFLPGQPGYGQLFTINSLTLGYLFDFLQVARARVGLGTSLTAYRYPDALQPAYGEGPLSLLVFLRVRL